MRFQGEKKAILLYPKLNDFLVFYFIPEITQRLYLSFYI